MVTLDCLLDGIYCMYCIDLNRSDDSHDVRKPRKLIYALYITSLFVTGLEQIYYDTCLSCEALFWPLRFA